MSLTPSSPVSPVFILLFPSAPVSPLPKPSFRKVVSTPDLSFRASTPIGGQASFFLSLWALTGHQILNSGHIFLALSRALKIPTTPCFSKLSPTYFAPDTTLF